MYCATYSILRDAVPPFLQNAFVLREYNTSELLTLLGVPMSGAERQAIDAFHQTRYKHEEGCVQEVHKEKLDDYFLHVTNKSERNEAIKKAYEDGYSKSELARKVILSVAGVSKILKS